ncbi:RICIN domain-containing protein [Nonomuraea sp. NPDC050643]|uniref:RICIN domain-containing protein n=1 Tax=Nonomuraea sp. NPDC050643 TaxID=3155660 RepID=UPI0033C24FFA
MTALMIVTGAGGFAPSPVAAAPADPCAGMAADVTCENDVFPGARLGERTGPRAEESRLTRNQATAAALAAPAGIPCVGDGVSGKRVEVLYVREPAMPDRYDLLSPMFQAWLANADDVYNDAAAKNGKSRHIRYATEAVSGGGCRIAVRRVEVPVGSLVTFADGITAVKALGYDKADRRYLMLTESTVVCGVGQRYVDDRPGAENYNNTRLAYARVDATANCFGPNAIAHELGHMLGAVQTSAPHTDNSGHCSDQFSMMCYGGTPTFNCLEWNDRRLPDCNRDDYFSLAPTAGSYLATHWNIANNDFLVKGDTVDATAHPTVGSTYVITNVSTGGALEPIDGSTARLTRLSQRPPSGARSQKWLMSYRTGLQLTNAAGGLCADSAYSGTTSGTQVLQYTCNGQDGMRWAYLPQADGSYAIINWLSGLALTVTGAHPAPLEQRPYTGTADQLWKFTRSTEPGPQAGQTYHLTGVKSRDNAEVLDASTTAGASVVHKPHSGATSQRWTLRRATIAADAWHLINANSGMCLNLKSATDADGTQIVQSACGAFTGTTLTWRLRRAADGTYVLVNQHSNKALNMTTAALSVLDQQTLAGNNDNHFWSLAPV